MKCLTCSNELTRSVIHISNGVTKTHFICENPTCLGYNKKADLRKRTTKELNEISLTVENLERAKERFENEIENESEFTVLRKTVEQLCKRVDALEKKEKNRWEMEKGEDSGLRFH